jgi:hypothetical protein
MTLHRYPACTAGKSAESDLSHWEDAALRQPIQEFPQHFVQLQVAHAYHVQGYTVNGLA